MSTNETKVATVNSEISVIDRSNELRNMNSFMSAKNMKIVTVSDYSSSFPNQVGLSIFISGSANGKAFETSKTKSIKVEKLDNIRKTLDSMGSQFSKQSLERTSNMSFKKLLNGLLDNILENNFESEEEED